MRWLLEHFLDAALHFFFVDELAASGLGKAFLDGGAEGRIDGAEGGFEELSGELFRGASGAGGNGGKPGVLCGGKLDLHDSSLWKCLLYYDASYRSDSGAVSTLRKSDNSSANHQVVKGEKIGTIVLVLWKRGVCFNANHLKPEKA